MNDRPNIIYILADDMGYGDVSWLNENAGFKTPNLDRLGSEGLSFTDAHATSAVCTPSRYSLLTGRYNWRSSLKKDVLRGYDLPLIEGGRTTIGSYLQDKGYKTACIGKWHLGMQWPLKDLRDKTSVDFSKPLITTPNDYGFDYFFGISASLDMPPYVYIENKTVTSMPDREVENDWQVGGKLNKQIFRRGPAGSDFIHEEVLDKLTDRVIEQIEVSKEKPFFIYYPMTAPHSPILPTTEFIGKSGTNEYGDFVLMCDNAVGKILKKVEELGIEEDTIIIFTSDNGCSPRVDYSELAQYGHNPSYIYRGHKFDIYDGGHRVPYIIKWPGKIEAGGYCNDLISLSDLLATMAEYFGDKLPNDTAEDSVSNLSAWFGDAMNHKVREALVHHSVNGSFSIRKGKWKLILCPGSGGFSDPLPNAVPEHFPVFQLYEMDVDVRERRNVLSENMEVAKDLRQTMISYVLNGRSTSGEINPVSESDLWDELSWMEIDL